MQRIVFLGDSITDGHTYPLLVQQALRAAGAPAPEIFNAGIGGDTALGMSGRLEEDVLFHQPTLVTLSAGMNDAMKGVTLEDYVASVTIIADTLRGRGISLVIMTTSIFGPKYPVQQSRVDEYNTWLRGFAGKRGLAVAEVSELFKKTARENPELAILGDDDVHPILQGQRLLARAVLDALGHTGVPVPADVIAEVIPGTITPWLFRAAPAGAELTDGAARELTDRFTSGKMDGFKTYNLPDADAQDDVWLDQERRRGFGLSLTKLIGGAELFQGVATLENPVSELAPVLFNTGSGLRRIWLNGAPIYQHIGWRGWHAGRDRVHAELKPGTNVIIIECGTQFFLSAVLQ